jgi:hypothetical protein
MRNNWSSSGGDPRYQSKPFSGWSSNKQVRTPSQFDDETKKKRSANWSREWNTVNIEMPTEPEKKRKFGSGWDAEKPGELDTAESNLFVFSLNGNNSVEREEIEFKRKEKVRSRASTSSNFSTIPQLPIDPFEVSHCPSWVAKRRLRCKLATTKPCGKHVIFEA